MAMIMYLFTLGAWGLGPAPSPVPDRGREFAPQQNHGRQSRDSNQGPERRESTPLSIVPCVKEGGGGTGGRGE